MVSLDALRALADQYQDKRCTLHPEGRLSVVVGEGQATVWCQLCKSRPAAFVEAAGPTSRYRRGQPLPAAVHNQVERRLGVTAESKALVEGVQATPPARLPNEAEVKQILSVFHGWSKDGQGRELVPSKPTAVILWKLIQMGFAPQDINLIGNRPYVNVGGFTAHAHRYLAAQNRIYGVDFMDRVRMVYAAEELDLAGARQGDTTMAWEFCVPQRVVETKPDGTKIERTEWFPVATEYGRGNGTNTVIKTPQGGEQPIEQKHPQRMAWVRATHHGWRHVTPITLPADVGMFDATTKTAFDRDAIEGSYHTVPENSLAEGPAADTAAASPEVPEATQEPEQASSPAEAPVAPARQPEASTATPGTVPFITPTGPTVTLAEIRKRTSGSTQIVDALKGAGVVTVRDFSYSLQLGMDAVYQLAADGYSVEQIVAIVRGEAKPSLGW